MGTDVFGISVSALNTAQIGLSTTEHNIANANTPGYNRQTIVVNARQAQLTGSGYLGQGADVGSVKRIYDQFLSDRVTQQQGQASQLNTYYTQIQQINNLLADPNAGLSPALQDFFNTVNGVSSSPESMPARQSMLSSANSLVSRFQSLNQQLSNLGTSINGQITTSVTTVNSYATQIAALNQNIVMATAASGGKPPNDLLDQRDQIINQLNQEVNATVIKQGDGSYTVSVGTGQLLVVGNIAYGLQAVQSNSDPSKLEVATGTANGSIVRLQQSSIQGGTLGGLLAFRSQTLDSAQNSLGLVAMGVAGTFNQQHQLGQDINGVIANSVNSFFTDVAPIVNKNALNAGAATVAASVSDYSQLTGSDYSLIYNAAGYTLTRLSDNTTLFANQAALPAGAVDGLTLSVAGAPSAGDSFVIRPTVNGALSMGVTLTNPASIAASAPVLATTTLTNAGTARVSTGSVNTPPPVNASLQNNVTITFVDATHYTVTDTTAAAVLVAPPGTVYDPTLGATLSFNGWTTQISGNPVANDTFTVGANPNSTTDNRNALLLAGLQAKNTMISGGTSTYQGLYSQLVSQVGNKTRELQVTSTAQTTMVNQAIQAQQAVSGVNLDEEAANLMRYQRAYQAAGKAMQIANTLFDTLIQLGR